MCCVLELYVVSLGASCIYVVNSFMRFLTIRFLQDRFQMELLMLYIFVNSYILSFSKQFFLTSKYIGSDDIFPDTLKKIILKSVMLKESLLILQWKLNSQLGQRKQVVALSWLVVFVFFLMCMVEWFFPHVIPLWFDI